MMLRFAKALAFCSITIHKCAEALAICSIAFHKCAEALAICGNANHKGAEALAICSIATHRCVEALAICSIANVANVQSPAKPELAAWGCEPVTGVSSCDLVGKSQYLSHTFNKGRRGDGVQI